MKLCPPIWSGRPLVLGNRAAAYMMLDRFIEAVDDCDEALKLDPTALKICMRKGRALLRLGHFTPAKETFSAVLAETERDILRAARTQAMGKKDEADTVRKNADYYKSEAKVAMREVDKVGDLVQLLICAEGKLDFTDVRRTCDKILSVSPGYRVAQFSKCNALCELRNYTEAKQFIETWARNTHRTMQQLYCHQSVALQSKFPRPEDLCWNESLTDGMVLVKLSAVVQAFLYIGAEMGAVYLKALKNVDACKSCCADVINKVLLLLKELKSKLNLQELQGAWIWVAAEIKKVNDLVSYKNLADKSFREKNFKNAVSAYGNALKVYERIINSVIKLVFGISILLW